MTLYADPGEHTCMSTHSLTQQQWQEDCHNAVLHHTDTARTLHNKMLVKNESGTGLVPKLPELRKEMSSVRWFYIGDLLNDALGTATDARWV